MVYQSESRFQKVVGAILVGIETARHSVKINQITRTCIKSTKSRSKRTTIDQDTVSAAFQAEIFTKLSEEYDATI